MTKTLYESAARPNRNSSDSISAAVPIPRKETEQFKDRLRESIGDRKLVRFAQECGFSDSLLGAYLRGEKLPGLENLVAMANVGGVTVDWLATGRPPRTRGELAALSALALHGASAKDAPDASDTWRLAVEVVQEWQVKEGRLLPPEKFMRALELLVELSDGEPSQVRALSAKVLRLAA